MHHTGVGNRSNRDAFRVHHLDPDPSFSGRLADAFADGDANVDLVHVADPDVVDGTLRGADCLLTEWHLDGDGTDAESVVRRVADDETAPPVLVLTDARSPAVAERATAAGAARYLRKPDGDDDLGAVADRVATAVEETAARAERLHEFRESHDRLSTFIAAFPDYAYVYDADGVYLDVILGREAEMRRFTAADLLGESMHDLLDDDTAEAIQAAIDKSLRTEEVTRVEYRMDEPDGVHWFEGRIAPLPPDAEEAPGVVLVAHDVTPQHEYRERLERQNERLDRFASLVSHDLRSPLNVAAGRIGLAREQATTETDEHLASAQQALDRMDELIGDLLDIARSGRRDVDTEPTDLEAAVRAAWQGLSDPRVTFEIEDGLGTVAADPDDLARLLDNLLRNAVEHGGRDRDAVTVTVGPTADGFYVADDGPGVPSESHDRLFEPGYTTSPSGTGFGLEVVENVADAHDWTVEVTESEAGGARFEVGGVRFVEPATE